MLFTSYRWHLFILYDVIVLCFYFIFHIVYFLFYSYFIFCKPHEANIAVQRPISCKPSEAQMFLFRGLYCW